MSESAIFLQLSVGFILFVTGVCASCPIELSPPTVVVKHGDSVSVNCSTSESVFEGMGWEASQGGIGFQPVNHLLWTVKSLTEWNISPICYINFNSQQCNKELNVIVYRFPETINIRSNSGYKITMTEGKNIDLTCDIIDIAPVQNLTVRWYRGDQILHIDTLNGYKEPSNQSSIFSHTPTRQDHQATFRCEAYMDLGPEGPQFNVSSQEYDVEVLYGPDRKCPITVTVSENTPHKLTCSEGFPQPIETWYKDGKKVELPEILTRSESGQYSVNASSANSWILFTVNISVLYGPEQICSDTYIVQEYSNHKSCSQGFPPPKEIWYYDDEEVELPDILTRRDSGQYSVNASNANSWIRFTVNITVLYPPSIIDDLEDSEVQVGDTLKLKCSSKSNPMPNYSWSYSYMPMPNVKSVNEDGVSFLIIHNATGNNIGSYKCNVANEGGHVSKTVRVTVKGAKSECPIKITPNNMVLQYQSRGQPVICEPLHSESTNIKEIYWKTQQNIITHNSTWLADTQKDWDPKPTCYAKFQANETCHKDLKYILYKTPDSVSIRADDGSASVKEGSRLRLQCDVFNVAPAQNLKVLWIWYTQNDTVETVEDNDVQSNYQGRSPVNISRTLFLNLSRNHNAVKLQCEAQLWPEKHQSTPKMRSNLLNINVLYKPIINTTKLPETVPVFRGYPEELICEADGNPPPNITWDFSSNTARRMSDNRLLVFEAGLYNCTATNFDSTKHVVTVILEEDYQPLIAGFVAVIVVAISVIFLFIYSIYYKNTKMRRYNFKNPKLSTQNGNVAHNGWDLQFPMTKLS